ncbi:MAG TPA: hypothetical protein VHK87_19230, partial [Phenylobacterium sp.]|nr:hypothetical protein [Phenylobacterium sp.]
ADEGFTAEQAAQPRPGQMAIRIRTVFGASIPVIVRQGERAAAAEIRNVRLVPQPGGGSVVALELARRGESSLYGDLVVRVVGAPASDPPLATARGVGVYAEIDHRTFELPLRRRLGKGEQLEILFKDEEAHSGQVLASLAYTVT